MFSLPKTRLRKNDSSLSFGEVVPSASGIRNWNSETRRNSLIRKIDNLVASQEEQKDTEEEISAVKLERRNKEDEPIIIELVVQIS
ncbi:hypothetical protein MJO28_015941 [Puccinia striiformis f. sp. tritici]|uniref:Uncharacterized protein n=1 Tax=Puccinia striiformis f. sp. tritici TaxID=168172 RepID=A0ACC0DQR0_9BASI|nr:hypothetical protein MJO28_015941 [Puccinia striiformis f. sp. tritici]